MDPWITAVVLVATFGVLALDRYPPSAVVFAGAITLTLAGVIGPDEAFSGFANPAPLTVAALYVLAAGAQRTALLTSLVHRSLRGSGDRRSLTRMALPVAGASAVFNNTPLVAMVIPEVIAWARRSGVSASRFLLPLSFAAILGGTVTVLGTSTNLVVSGLLADTGADPIGVFELASLGLPVAAVGLVLLVVLAPRLVPDRRTLSDQVGTDSRDFTVEMEVIAGGELDGVTVADGALRDLRGVYLAEIARSGRLLAPVSPDEALVGGDRLIFVGQVDQVLDLQQRPGLRSAETRHLRGLDGPQTSYYEAVVGRTSPLVGRTLRDTDFRSTHGAAVLAVHRAGERVAGQLGRVTLRHGDTLVLVGRPGLRQAWQEQNLFLVASPIDSTEPVASRKAPLVALALVAFVALAATGVLSTLEGAVIAAGIIVASKVLNYSQALRAVNLDVILLIAGALGLGAAVEASGLAVDIAEGFVSAFEPTGQLGIVIGVMLALTLLTEIITNNAAAAVVFPIGLEIAAGAGIEPRAMALAIAVMASSSFLTPVGYQTNTMVYGPGGYRFFDYLRLGVPLKVVVIAIVSVITVL